MDTLDAPAEVKNSKDFTRSSRKGWTYRGIAVIGGVALTGAVWILLTGRHDATAAKAIPLPPQVTVSLPVQRELDTQIGMLGQFSAVDRVEIRAQVAGTLTEIHFLDGDIVKKGDLLFVIDPRPYEIKRAQAKAALDTANARLALAKLQLNRAQVLRQTMAGSQENLDQRASEEASAAAAVEDAQARIRDAELDLEYSRVTAPFTGRIGARQVSKGSLITGSRSPAGPTTLLATMVSLDPIYLDFNMSESDYLAFSRARARSTGILASRITIALSDEDKFTRTGTLDFLDNALNRSSGTIQARATVANSDLFLTPGAFARIRLAVAPPAPTLLVPDVAVMLDQSRRIVMTVDADGSVVPKPVTVGELRGGLRVIRSGLEPGDRVVIDGLARAVPGARVSPKEGDVSFNASVDGRG